MFDELRISLFLPNFAPAHGSYQIDKAPTMSEQEGDEPDFEVSFDLGSNDLDFYL